MPGAAAATTVTRGPLPPLNGKGKLAPAKWDSESEDSEDDIPLAASSVPPTPAKSRTNGNSIKEEDNSDPEAPANKAKAKAKPARATKRRKTVKEESESEDEIPLSQETPKKKPAAKRGAKRVKKEEEDSGEEDVKPKKRARVKKEDKEKGDKAKTKEEKAKAKKDKAKKDKEEEEIHRWWEAQENGAGAMGDGTQKWVTLVHSGVLFAPPYEPLPKNVKMKYNGKPVELPPAAEEVAGFYGAMIETDHAKDATFNQNFFADFQKVLKKNPPVDGTKITDFNKCDFRPMLEFFEAEKAKKKSLTAAEKKELKAQKDAAELKYTTCLLDGRKEKVGNYRIEPPGLFRGRGEHPKKGALKLRVRPEDVTINIGSEAPVPVPNVGGNWKEVIHDNTVTWLATWVENVNGNHKYVFLAAGSSLKGQSDMNKFEKARELKNHIDRIRADYTSELTDKQMATRMRATAMYFIDVLALRAGNEKGEDEADTVGCCSLRCEHVTLDPGPPQQLVFDFLGKDSIRYYNKVEVSETVFKNIKIFKKNKEDSDDLFDRLSPGLLNKHLQAYMKGLSAKVFRTYNASITFQKQLDDGTPADGTLQEKLNHYNHANRMVAILCNHQRAAPKTHEQSMGKMKDKLRGMKYERMKLRHALFSLDAKYKKKKAYSADESDFDDDDIVEVEEQLKEKELERVQKKFAKENEKLVADDEPEQGADVLAEREKAVVEEYKRLAKERGTGKAKLKRDRAPEKIEEAIGKIDERIKTFKLQMEDREAGKEVALGTSKINYLDPRITAAWCKKHEVPIEKLFSKTLLTKFPWALEVDANWQF
ncbi:hypothetical protein PENSPDRAFT_591194 [Peniophora sp. CONT]|nr:hypothetical protein PENSPDRAFT_591194 [Peniophora sp. CONT]